MGDNNHEINHIIDKYEKLGYTGLREIYKKYGSRVLYDHINGKNRMELHKRETGGGMGTPTPLVLAPEAHKYINTWSTNKPQEWKLPDGQTIHAPGKVRNYTDLPELYNPLTIKTVQNQYGVTIEPHFDERIADLDVSVLKQVKERWGVNMSDSMAENLQSNIQKQVNAIIKYSNEINLTNKAKDDLIKTLQNELNGLNIFKEIFFEGLKILVDGVEV